MSNAYRSIGTQQPRLKLPLRVLAGCVAALFLFAVVTPRATHTNTLEQVTQHVPADFTHVAMNKVRAPMAAFEGIAHAPMEAVAIDEAWSPMGFQRASTGLAMTRMNLGVPRESMKQGQGVIEYLKSCSRPCVKDPGFSDLHKYNVCIVSSCHVPQKVVDFCAAKTDSPKDFDVCLIKVAFAIAKYHYIESHYPKLLDYVKTCSKPCVSEIGMDDKHAFNVCLVKSCEVPDKVVQFCAGKTNGDPDKFDDCVFAAAIYHINKKKHGGHAMGMGGWA